MLRKIKYTYIHCIHVFMVTSTTLALYKVINPDAVIHPSTHALYIMCYILWFVARHILKAYKTNQHKLNSFV